MANFEVTESSLGVIAVSAISLAVALMLSSLLFFLFTGKLSNDCLSNEP